MLLGERSDIIWGEIEAHKKTWTEIGLPQPVRWDAHPRF